MTLNRSLIAPTSNPLLENALIDKLQRRFDAAGSLGELGPIAVRLGLMQNTLKPRFREPQLVVFASDHGLAVDGIEGPLQRQTHEVVGQLLGGALPITALARLHGLELTVVDCGMADRIAPHDRLLARKIAHGTRNARVGPAMTMEQAHAAIRAGMEIGDALRGNMVACAGLGVGSHEAAALVIAQLTRSPLPDLVAGGPDADAARLEAALAVLAVAQARHQEAVDPVEVLAAFGGFETAVMVGVMLVAASKRHLIMIDGMAACAALMVAGQIAPAVTEYCLFCRSHSRLDLDHALALFGTGALLELGLDTLDGTGACISWPLVRSAAALLTEVADSGERADTGFGRAPDPGAPPSQPGDAVA